MTAWAATAIRLKYPEAQITWAVEKRCASTLDLDQLVNHRVGFDRSRGASHRGRLPGLIRSYLKLRGQGFDWGIDFQGHGKTALALRIAKPRERIAVGASDPFSARLNPIMTPPPRGIHVIERNHLALSSFGEFEVPERPLMPSLCRTGPGCGADVVIAVGAGQPAKTWPIDRWEEASRALSKRGLRVVLIGGPGDPIPNTVAGENWVGKLTLAESMAAIASAGCVLCGDTGAGHIAAAYGTPVVSIFGPTSPRTYRPWTANGCILHRGSSVEDVSVEEAVYEVGERVKEPVRL